MDSSHVCRAFVAWALLVCAFCPFVAFAADGQKYSLKTDLRPDQVIRVEAALQVGGDLQLVSEGKPKNLPMSVVANLSYDEQRLANGPDASLRAVRYYTNARAVIKVDKGGEKPTLSSERRLIAVEKGNKTSPLLFCPTSPLTREELDLIDIPGNTLLFDQLLPERKVALGDKWKLTDQTLTDLVGLEAVSWTDVESMLGQINDEVAEISAAGSVSGAIGGVSTEIELKAKYKFDLKQKQITYLALLIKEKRTVGTISPGLDTVAKLIMKMGPISQSEHLTAEAIESVPETPTPEQRQLSYRSAGGRFHFGYDRRWFLTNDDSKLTVLRLLDRGELIAQCNISPLPSKEKKPISLAEFQLDVENSLGKHFGQFVNASQDTNDAGYTIYRVVVHGTVSELPIEWIYYLIEDPQGQRVSLAFTLDANLQERFARADRVLASDVRLAALATPTAAKSEPASDQEDSAAETSTTDTANTEADAAETPAPAKDDSPPTAAKPTKRKQK